MIQSRSTSRASPNGDNITVTELLNMRSGLYTYDDDPAFWAVLEHDPTKVWRPAEVLAIAFKHPPYFPPGTDFHYSNTNYALLGLIAEKIDGNRFRKSCTTGCSGRWV
jgi:D-alanyl-D-alanine carboxypeptidase